jgi:hypothetical protein
MYFLDFILSGTALLATLIIAIIPLQYEIYHRETHQYTTQGKWFVVFAIIAIVSWLTTPLRLYKESLDASGKNQLEQESLIKEIDSLKIVSVQKIKELKKEDSLQIAAALEKAKDSLGSNMKTDSLGNKPKDTSAGRPSDSLRNQASRTEKVKPPAITKNKSSSPLKKLAPEKELSEDEKMILMNSLEQARKRYNIKNNCVELAVNEGSHPGDFLPHLRTFLKNKGYETKDNKAGLVVSFFYGVVVTVNKNNCFSIQIGNLKKTPIIFRVQ